MIKVSLKKGLMYVFLANLLNLCISLIKGFVLPKYLSIEAYAMIQSYLLYVSYIGLLHFGYLDGLYLKYGGQKFENIDALEINLARGNTILLQLLFTIPAIVISLILKNYVLLFFSLSILPVNIVTLYKNLFQATGLFKTYGRLLNVTTLLSFIGTLILLFFFHLESAFYYIFILVFVDYLIWILLEINLFKKYKIPFKLQFSLKNLAKHIKSGFVLMLGNFSSIMMTSMDRWFIKILLTVEEFAYYSFAVRVENLITVFITPVITTMYNYFCQTKDTKNIKNITKTCLLVGLCLIGCAFPVKFILETFLTKYYDSSAIIFLLFSTQALYLIIKGVYVNIYKSRKEQNKYFKQLVLVIIIGFLLNLLLINIFHNTICVALATLISVLIWFGICLFSIPEIRLGFKELIVLVISLILYNFLGFYVNSYIGFIIYYGCLLMLLIIFMKDTLIQFLNIIKSLIVKKGVKQ